MRYSSNVDDPGYQNWVDAGCIVKVILDDIELPDVQTCDTAEGWALMARRDNRGHIVVRNGEVAFIKVVGKVEVEYDQMAK